MNHTGFPGVSKKPGVIQASGAARNAPDDRLMQQSRAHRVGTRVTLNNRPNGGDGSVMDPWQVIGVEPTASLEEASRAHKLQIQLVHPDRHQGASQEVIDFANQRTSEINSAWEDVKKAIAGRYGQADGGPPNQPCSSSQHDPRSDEAHLDELKSRQKEFELLDNHAKVLSECAVTPEQRLDAQRAQMNAVSARLAQVEFIRAHAMATGDSATISKCDDALSMVHRSISRLQSEIARADRHHFETIRNLSKLPTGTPVKCNRCLTVTWAQDDESVIACQGCSKAYQRCHCGKFSHPVKKRRGDFYWKCSCGKRNPLLT